MQVDYLPAELPGKPNYLYVYGYKNVSTMFDKGLRENIKKKKKRRYGEIGKHKLNEMGALDMK